MKNLLIYYGYLNSFNSATNSWNNQRCAEDLVSRDIIVMGETLADTAHADYANTKVIIPEMRRLKPEVLLFGYVKLSQSYANFKSEVDEWLDNTDFGDDIDGIFVDEAGYDFGTSSTNTREQFNLKLQYIHSKGAKAFVNAWKLEHIYGSNSDVSYPDTTWNADKLDSLLGADDWYLLENHAITAGNYESFTQWYDRGTGVAGVPFNVAAVSVISDTDSSGQDKSEFSEISASMFALQAWGTSDTSYGASSGKAKLWDRILPGDIGPAPVKVTADDRAWSYGVGRHAWLDFTSTSEDSALVIY